MRVLIASAATLFAAGIAAEADAQQSPEASLAQDLANCAGAVAAIGNLDVISYPQGANGEWSPLLGDILDALNREQGLEGMTGRYAASAARSYWTDQARGAQQTAAVSCRARFGRE